MAMPTRVAQAQEQAEAIAGAEVDADAGLRRRDGREPTSTRWNSWARPTGYCVKFIVLAGRSITIGRLINAFLFNSLKTRDKCSPRP
jgi:hypothetical protein